MNPRSFTTTESPRKTPLYKVDIETLVAQKLSPAPSSLLRLVKLLSDYSTPRAVLVEEINRDPILVARVLRLANSPIYSFEREIMLIDMALTAVGSQTIYDIVVVELAARTVKNGVSDSVEFRKLWEHSFAVGVLTKAISSALEMRGLDQAFVCGLLHDLGKFIFLNYDLPGYGQIIGVADEHAMLKFEEEMFGFDHSEVGAYVAARWNLPDEICNAIGNHHSLQTADQPTVVEHIIQIADLLANVKGFGLRAEPEESLRYSESAVRLGLTPKYLENIWRHVESSIVEVINTFG